MKRVIFIFTACTLLLAQALYAESKRYDVASGVLQYELKTTGSVMGLRTNTQGTKTIHFKEYGSVELQEIHSTETNMGRTQKYHEMLKFENGIIKHVDFEEKVIVKQDMRDMMENKDMHTMGKEMLEEMGGKKVGEGEVLGYDCEIWEAMGTKMWIYKGIPLKLEADMMGIKTTEVATQAKFGVNVSDDKLTLPDYPEKSMQQMMQNEMMKPDTDGNAPSPEELKQMQEMMKNLGGMLGGK